MSGSLRFAIAISANIGGSVMGSMLRAGCAGFMLRGIKDFYE